MKKKSIKKLLVANRGEIALRIMRSAKEMGIETVAVYSEVDRLAPHVLMADEAYCIGPAPASESYLNMDSIISVALKCGADAIHPGYGFLAENDRFAQKVIDAGLIFVGPDPHTIRLMGNKTAARRRMEEAGVPTVPGTREPIDTVQQAREIIQQLGGYPILIKAAAGGGGKGMRIVRSDEELPRALEAGRSEALKAFGDGTVYIEKFLEAPKHIEVQILADRYGNCIHLWERDCSIQRRHQKVIEECPSVVLTPEKRQKMGEIAVRAALACDYVNAGTVEFLYDAADNFYFLEMNTRLQVEHPVTELVMGVDLVKLQLQIAAGEPLPLQQEDVQPRGHAIECRIYAEDVFNNFAPSTGKIEYLKIPEGPGVRVDNGIAEGQEISLYYDPLIAKLVVWGKDRREALARTKRALEEYQIYGVQTTIPFCLEVVSHPRFVEGKFDTTFVDNYWKNREMTGSPAGDRDTQFDLAVILTAAIASRFGEKVDHSLETDSRYPSPPISLWKLRALREMLGE